MHKTFEEAYEEFEIAWKYFAYEVAKIVFSVEWFILICIAIVLTAIFEMFN